MLIGLTDLKFGYGDNEIFHGVTLAVNRGDRIGLVGANGAGKTTLLNCICGALTIDEGSIAVASGVKIGYLRQNSGLDRACTVTQEMESVFSHIFNIEHKMQQVQNEMTVLQGAGYDDAAARYAALSDEFEAADGYAVPVKIRTVLTGMGFSDVGDQIISTLSGGEKTRLALAKLLLEAPDVLILDEPTNHLDFKTLSWLEDYLEDYSGAIIVVSHDRYFLDKRCNRIWELEDNEISTYRGNYTSYKLQKEERTKAALKEYEKETARIVSMKEYAERNIARASTSNMAKSRLHQLEHVELPKKPKTAAKQPRFSFESDITPVKDVLDIHSLALTVGDPPVRLTDPFDLHVLRSQRVAVIGLNGTGKSTLIKRIARSKETPDDNILWGRNTSVSVFDQEGESFEPYNTVMDELWRHKRTASPQDVRDRLGHMLFSGEDVYKLVCELSGGERARLAFAILAQQKANVMLLDEPTNHLDLPAREALENAAKSFDGTLMFVSHDRYFINTLATRILEIKDGKVRVFEGNYDQYLQTLKKEEEDKRGKQAEYKPESETKISYHRSKQQRADEAKRKKRIYELEELIAECETKEKEANEQLSLPEVASDFEKVAELCALIEECRRKTDEYIKEWEKLSQ